MLWSEGFAERSLAPVYDLTCTTVYPLLDRETGVSLCASRKIDDVTDDDLMAAAKEICVGKKIARTLLESSERRFRMRLTMPRSARLRRAWTRSRRWRSAFGWTSRGACGGFDEPGIEDPELMDVCAGGAY